MPESNPKTPPATNQHPTPDTQQQQNQPFSRHTFFLHINYTRDPNRSHHLPPLANKALKPHTHNNLTPQKPPQTPCNFCSQLASSLQTFATIASNGHFFANTEAILQTFLPPFFDFCQHLKDRYI